MATDKLLNRIREQIRILEKDLDAFRQQVIQPSAADCEGLQNKLHQLQEQLAVYKYHKQNHELSPSFAIHARVSEEVQATAPAAAESGKSIEAPRAPEPEKTPKPLAESNSQKTPIPAAISIGLNDKFRFINELFSQNPAEYNIAIEQLNGLHSWPESEVYMSSLKTLYTWKDNQEVVKRFYALVKRRFE